MQDKTIAKLQIENNQAKEFRDSKWVRNILEDVHLEFKIAEHFLFDKLSFRNSSVKDGVFRKCVFAECQLDQASFSGCVFDECTFHSVQFPSSIQWGQMSKFLGCTFLKGSFGGWNQNTQELLSCTFANCEFRSASYARYELKSDFTRCNFHHSTFAGTIFNGCDFSNTSFSNCRLQGTKWPDCNLYNSIFSDQTSLAGADLTRAMISAKTDIKQSDVSGLRIDADGLLTIDSDLRPSPGQQKFMRVVSPLNDLRNTYSGVKGLILAVSVFSFALPYAYYLTKLFAYSKMSPVGDLESTPIWKAFLVYVATGGSMSSIDFLSVLVFISLLYINSCRLLLIAKTHELEHYQRVTGIPPDMTFMSTPRWSMIIGIANDMRILLIYYTLVVIHIIHFMGLMVPNARIM